MRFSHPPTHSWDRKRATRETNPTTTTWLLIFFRHCGAILCGGSSSSKNIKLESCFYLFRTWFGHIQILQAKCFFYAKSRWIPSTNDEARDWMLISTSFVFNAQTCHCRCCGWMKNENFIELSSRVVVVLFPWKWMRNSQNSANLANSIQVALFVFFLFFAYMQSPRRTNKQAQKKSNHICSKSNELENLSSTAHITYYANLGLAAVVHFSLWNTQQ